MRAATAPLKGQTKYAGKGSTAGRDKSLRASAAHGAGSGDGEVGAEIADGPGKRADEVVLGV
ncbi:hypothetical protein GCM10010466_42840 [Planomonospora alba]|uniref:Uncharacterized protein n=1 Tax=Planomonospora alba TaxID=161354 RepID=A0ABP6NH36_9ACTN